MRVYLARGASSAATCAEADAFPVHLSVALAAATLIVWVMLLGPFTAQEGPLAALERWCSGSRPAVGGSIRMLVAALAWCFVLCNRRAGLEGYRRRLTAAVFALAAMEAVGGSLRESWLAVLTWLPLFALSLVRAREARFLSFAAVAMLLLQVMLGFAAYIRNYRQFLSPIVGERASGLLGTPTAVYPIYLLAALIFGHLALNSPRRDVRAAFAAGCAASLALEVLTFCRSGWLGLAAALFLSSPHIRRPAKRAAFAVGLTLCVSAFFVRSDLWRGGPLLDRSTVGHFRSIATALGSMSGLSFAGGGLHEFDGQLVTPKSVPVFFISLWGGAGLLMLLEVLRSVWRVCGSGRCPSTRLVIATYSAFVIASAIDVPVFGDISTLPATSAFVAVLGLAVSRSDGVVVSRWACLWGQSLPQPNGGPVQ